MSHIKAIIAEQNVTFRPADMLFIRVGFTAGYDTLTKSERQEFPARKPGGLLGLVATEESLRWLWERSYNDPDMSIHQWCLARWGMPIGELIDLEELAKTCRELRRWTFFLSSVPLKLPGGVVGPANAVAIM